jgi:general secretion pathway protein G
MNVKRSQSPRLHRSGFTLAELLVVLSILVVLLALVLPRVLGSKKKADIKLAKSQIGLFRGPLEEYAVDCKGFPTTEQGLEALVVEPPDLPSGAKWSGPYIDEVPKDPWGQDFQYQYPPEYNIKDFPDIWSYGPDFDDDSDDICNWTKDSESADGTDVLMGEDRGKGGRDVLKGPRRDTGKIASGKTASGKIASGRKAGGADRFGSKSSTSRIGADSADLPPVKGGRGAAKGRTVPRDEGL